MLTAPPWTRKHFWLCSPSLQMLKFLGQQNTDLVCIYDKHFVPDVNFCVYFIDLKLRFSPTIWYHTVLICWTCENFWCSFATVILCDDMRSVWPSRSLALLARLQTQRQVNPLGVCGLTTQYTPHKSYMCPICVCACVCGFFINPLGVACLKTQCTWVWYRENWL